VKRIQHKKSQPAFNFLIQSHKTVEREGKTATTSQSHMYIFPTEQIALLPFSSSSSFFSTFPCLQNLTTPMPPFSSFLIFFLLSFLLSTTQGSFDSSSFIYITCATMIFKLLFFVITPLLLAWFVSHSSKQIRRIPKPHYSSRSSFLTIWLLEELFNVSQSSSCIYSSIQVIGISFFRFPALHSRFLHANIMCSCLYNHAYMIYVYVPSRVSK